MILLTRPLEDSQQTAKKLQKLGFKTKISPMFEIEFIKSINLVDAQYDAVIITSKHAAKIAAQFNWISNKQIFLVGNSSAECSTWNTSKTVAQNSDELLVHIKSALKSNSKILYICGDHIANNFDTKLADSGYEVVKSQVYKTLPCSKIDFDIPKDISTILFYSPRTAEIFSNLINNPLPDIKAICISQNTANKLNPNQFKSVMIAAEPTEKSMFQLL